MMFALRASEIRYAGEIACGGEIRLRRVKYRQSRCCGVASRRIKKYVYLSTYAYTTLTPIAAASPPSREVYHNNVMSTAHGGGGGF